MNRILKPLKILLLVAALGLAALGIPLPVWFPTRTEPTAAIIRDED